MPRCVLARASGRSKQRFRFHHISTDEVFGDLPFDSGIFTEETPYAPSSPYSASKAASDHLVRAWHETYGLPVVLSNCSNNYGPFHFPEKLIPLVILNALDEQAAARLRQRRQMCATGSSWRTMPARWNCRDKGHAGRELQHRRRAERTNLSVVETICDILDRKRPRRGGARYRDLITFVTDRPGHDRRYAIDASKIERELGWRRGRTFETGLARTIDWYLANEWWWQPIRAGTLCGRAARR
jgi:dTDP-glucose 4,6-dehydratase